MEREESRQLELFSAQSTPLKEGRSFYDRSFIKLLWSYEKTILTIIAIILTGIISFSLGIEKGRRLQVAPAVAQIKNTPPKAPAAENISGAYTIQLASYRTRTYAQREAQALKQNGFSPLLISKGNITALCVGNFPNRQTAQASIFNFQRRYQGCYVRRL